MNLLHLFGFTSRFYRYPVLVEGKVPKTYLQLGFRSPAHAGKYYHAQDFLIPDPRIASQQIIVPASGIIRYLIQNNDVFGNGDRYSNFTNVLTVQVSGIWAKPGCGFYEFSHIGKDSCPYKIGDKVKRGDILATTGLNGWVTETNGIPDYHLHFMAGYLYQVKKYRYIDFKTVKILYSPR